MAQSFSWIIVGNKPGGALAPSSAYANANTRVRLDVPDVARPATVLGDDPEDAVVEAVGNRVASRPPGLAADRLQDRSPRGRKPEAKQPADDGIDHVLRRPAGEPSLRLTATRHEFATYRPRAAIAPPLDSVDRGPGLRSPLARLRTAVGVLRPRESSTRHNPGGGVGRRHLPWHRSARGVRPAGSGAK